LTALTCILAVASAAGASDDGLQAALEFRQEHGAEVLADYARLLSLPNVATEPAGLYRTAEAIREALVLRGVAAELSELPDAPPVVLGRLESPGAQRTLGIYAHYDGQPVDAPRWTHPPFEPTLYSRALERGGQPIPFPGAGEPIDPEWRLYGRSSADDKAPIGALLAALDALRRADLRPSSNLVFLFEGEEERGSVHLGDYLDALRDRVDTVDLWLICDGPVHQSRQPQLVFGVRGVVGLEVRVYGAERYLHSGHYGNWAPNPALELARLLASFKDENGRVRVDGFYDGVASLSSTESEALARVPDIDAQLRNELGLARTEGGGASLAERILLPSLNIRGLESATVGDTARNVIPTVADASIDIRLVAGNDPEAMLDRVEAHIRGQGFHIVRTDPDHATRLAHPKIARVVREPGYPAVRTRLDDPAVRPVIAEAERAAGGPVILLPSLGGSLPLYLFPQRFAVPLVIVPIVNHDNNQHAPDENLRLANLWYGVDLFAALFTMPPS